MSKKVTVLTGEQVSWPPHCARCGDKGNLTAVGASIGRVTQSDAYAQEFARLNKNIVQRD